MKLFLIAAILIFGVGAQSSSDSNESCTTHTPYPVYEFTKVLRLAVNSVPQVNCGDDPAEKIVRFNCMTSGDNQFRAVNFTDPRSVSTLNKNLKYGFIAHGFIGDCNSDWPLEMMRVWTEAESINVCCVDWSRWAKCNYIPDAEKYVYKVGDYLARTIETLIIEHDVNIDDVTLVGHSFGAIVVGRAGKNFLKHQLPMCIALDPAGYGYTKPKVVDPTLRLAATDCKVVKAMYTDGKGLGSKIPMAGVNVFVNGGSDQPQCQDKLFPCSHFAATTFFIESIRKNRVSNFTIVSDDGMITDTFTMYANDIPANYSMTTSKCFPFFLDAEQLSIPGGVSSIAICENCLLINHSIV